MKNQKQQSLQQKLQLCRNGDEQAAAELLRSYMPMIRRTANRLVCSWLETDDAVQEGVIALFSAVDSYRAAQHIPFEAYAAVCVRNAIIDARRAAGRMRHRVLNESVSLQDTAVATVCAGHNPQQQLELNERFSHTMKGIATRLSGMERQVLLLFLEGLSYAEIGRKMNLSTKAVDNALQRVRAKLK